MTITPEVTKNTLEAMAMCCAFAESVFTLLANSEKEEVTDAVTSVDIHFDEIEKLWMTHLRVPLDEEQVEALVSGFGEVISAEGLSSCGIWEFAHGAYHLYTTINPMHEKPTQH